jgi:hypothetical protein
MDAGRPSTHWSSSTAIAWMAPSGGGEQLERHRRGLGPRRRQWLGGEAEVKEEGVILMLRP